MNNFYKLVIRIILGIVFGVLLTRIFKPDWPLYSGICLGMVLVGLAYIMEFFRKKKS